MCGRTSLFASPGVLEERFGATFAVPYEPRYNVAPRDTLYAVPQAEESSIEAFQWGLLPHWADDPADAPRPINARVETVAEKPYFREAYEERRCLVLADGFYEWAGDRGAKEPYRIQRADEAPFAFAGLYEHWSGDGDDLATVTILTTEANAAVEPIHDRMPVILGPDLEDGWLTGDLPDDSSPSLRPVGADELEVYPVDTAVNDPSNDDPSVVEPLGTEQTGFDEFT